MKYLFVTKNRYSFGYEITEFATAEELTAHVEQHGAKDAIIAQRVGLQLQVCEWQAPDQKEENF